MKIPHAGRTHSPYVFSLEAPLVPLVLAYPIAAARDWQFRFPRTGWQRRGHDDLREMHRSCLNSTARKKIASVPGRIIRRGTRLTPSGSPFGRSTWPKTAKLSNSPSCLSAVRSEVYRALVYSIKLITCAHPVVPQIAEICAYKPLKAMIRGISMAQHETPDSVRIRPSRMQLRHSC
jgi:hypothetical protein